MKNIDLPEKFLKRFEIIKCTCHKCNRRKSKMGKWLNEVLTGERKNTLILLITLIFIIYFAATLIK